MPYKPSVLKPLDYRPAAPRLNAYQRGYDRRWQQASKWFLRRNLMCMCPQCQGKGLPANCVDHIVPHRGDKALFWDPSNWQAMNVICHNRKTAKHDMR